MNSFLTDLIYVFKSRVFVIIAGVLTSIITARYINPSGNGIISTLISYPEMFISLGALGIAHASTYLIGQKKYDFKNILSGMFTIWVLSAVTCVVLCFLSFKYFAKSHLPLSLIIISVATIPFNLFNNYATGVFLGTNNIKEFNTINWIPDILKLVVTILLVIIFPLDITGAVCALLMGHLVLFFLVGHKIHRLFDLKITFNFTIIKSILKLGILYALSLFIINLNYKIDVILLEKFSTQYQVGIYTKGVSVVQYLWEIPTIMSTIIFARSATASNPREFSLRVCRLLRICTIIILIIGIVFFFVSDLFMTLVYGEAFRASGTVQKLLIPGIWLLTFFKILNMDLVGKGMPLVAMKSMIPSLIINVVLNYFLIPVYGANGAAFSSTVSYSVSALLFLYFYSRAVQIPISEIFKYRKDDFLIPRLTTLKIKYDQR